MLFTLKFFPCWSLFENFHNKVTELRIVYSNTLLKLYKTLGQKFNEVYHRYRASLVAHTIKNLPEMEETWVRKILWRRKWQPLQHSCLGNPTDRGSRQATVHGASKSATGLSTHTTPAVKVCKTWIGFG